MLADLSEVARAQLRTASGHAFRDKGVAIFDPVTDIDEAVEAALAAAIRARFPDDFIWGEEQGGTHVPRGRVWSLDPIDGTRALICDLPSWSVLVGVIEDGMHVAGMIDLPALDQLLIAARGQTQANGVDVQTSGCSTLSEARLSTTDPGLFEGEEVRSFARVRERALVTRYGLDALAYARVATGGLDLVVENKLDRHDLDALVAVVRGAGGHIGDWSGGEEWDSGRIVAAATRALYDEAVAILSE
jgi:histidinol phosphatase-like enzyme (inositol monophosphatase family)